MVSFVPGEVLEAGARGLPSKDWVGQVLILERQRIRLMEEGQGLGVFAALVIYWPVALASEHQESKGCRRQGQANPGGRVYPAPQVAWLCCSFKGQHLCYHTQGPRAGACIPLPAQHASAQPTCLPTPLMTPAGP